MDVKAQQLASVEQGEILRGLAEAAARPNASFLEVGTWCGTSAVILAKVARQHQGRLFCVDWWKGSRGTALADIAAREDIFALFWERVCEEDLEDVVIPMRGPSDYVAQVLRPESFRLVFLDADHRYEAVSRDIEAYAPLVARKGGILCGHDCEGRPGDYDAEFLEAGKHLDCHESVHCGVVCAVGAAFPEVSFNHSIWSVRARGTAGWEPTNLRFPGVSDHRQASPGLIGTVNGHNLMRHGNRVYAVPHTIGAVDIRDPQQRSQRGMLSGATRAEAEELARQVPSVPVVVEEDYLGFNIVAYAGRYYSLCRSTGPLDLATLGRTAAADLKRQSRLFIANSHRVARLQVVLAGDGTRACVS